MKIREIGQSQRNDWNRCPAYHYHAYVMGTKGWGMCSESESAALSYGTIGHLGLATWYSHLKCGTPPGAAVRPAIDTMSRAIEEWKTARISDWSSDDNDGSDVTLASAFIEGYANHYGVHDTTRLTVEAIEWSFNLTPDEFYGPEVLDEIKLFGYTPADLPNIRGTIDLLLRTAEGLVVMDHKFEKWIGKDVTLGLPYWVQPITYVNAVSRIFKEPVLGYIHNQIRKPSGLKPRNAKGDVETWDQFLDRLRGEYLKFPDYEIEYRDSGRPKRGYFLRSPLLPITPGYSKTLVEMAIEDARRVQVYQPLPDIPGKVPPPPTIPRRHNSCGAYGTTCPYIKLCTYGYMPSTFEGLVERDVPHM